MNILDIALSAMILISAVVGLWRGLLREVLSLASWVAAVWVAYHYVAVAETYLTEYIRHDVLRVAIAFAVIFLGVLILAALLSRLICRMLAGSGLTGVDRVLGFFFGVARGVFIVVLLIFAALFMDLSHQPWWQTSGLVEIFIPIAELFKSFLPDAVAAHFQTPGNR